ncbi:MAG: MBOAT family protein [Deltaproteobacteria bacterium]|nr:MBOAT family protein [Deltaproteobacteria bacterium]
MSFASYSYIVFLLVAFIAHWSLPSRLRKPFLVAASYAFYATWDARFCALLLAVTLFSWGFGRFLARHEAPERWLSLGIAVELIPLFYFKYTNFALGTVGTLGAALGFDWKVGPLSIAVPLGVSFFCFQGVAYLVDVSTGSRPIERLPDFVLFKAFWPQLIAGPIIRPDEIHEQLERPRTLDHGDLMVGGERIVHGLFKKVVVADGVGAIVDVVFAQGPTPGLVDALVGAVGFGLQIYFDFSGYSDIAVGSARLFGYRFPENFDWPYTATSPQEFWNRWHMTLSSWIRSYIFTPLSFAMRRTPRLAPLSLVLAMALCGLWHGPAWTFVLWGVWHGVLLVLNRTLLRRFFAPTTGSRAGARTVAAWLVTFGCVCVGWILFRSRSLEQVGRMLSAIVTLRGGVRPMIARENDVLIVLSGVAALFSAQLLRGRLRVIEERLAERPSTRRFARALMLVVGLTLAIVLERDSQSFVYFQF